MNVKENIQATDDNSLELEGANEEEALQRACEALNTRLENLGYEVLSSSGRGLMGLMRGKKVRIKAWRKDERGEASLTEAGAYAKACLKEIIQHICSDFDIEVLEQAEAITLLIDGDEGGLTIGKNGQTLDAMQYLVRRMVSKKYPDYDRQLVVNTEGYRERKQESLESMAMRIAKKVRTSQRKEVLQPMSAYERRVIHMALQAESGVVTQSHGEGFDRYIVVYPESQQPAAESSTEPSRENS